MTTEVVTLKRSSIFADDLYLIFCFVTSAAGSVTNAEMLRITLEILETNAAPGTNVSVPVEIYSSVNIQSLSAGSVTVDAPIQPKGVTDKYFGVKINSSVSGSTLNFSFSGSSASKPRSVTGFTLDFFVPNGTPDGVYKVTWGSKIKVVW